MPKVLNQNELDALLDMVQAEGTESVEPSQSERGGVSAQPQFLDESRGYNVASEENVYMFDFKRPERVSTDQASALEVLHDTFARNVSASLSGYLRTVIDFRLISVEQFTYSEFTMSVPSPTIICSLSCRPLQGNLVLEMNPSIIYPFIDRLLGGGNGAQTEIIDRPFTTIEQSLINTILGRILDQLEESWCTITEVDFRIDDSETNPMLMQIVAPNEPVILLSFEVTMGVNSGLVNLCIPFKVIKPVIEDFTQTNWFSVNDLDSAGKEQRDLIDNIVKARLDLSVILAEVNISLADMLALQVGDIIDLGKGTGSELLLKVEDEPSFVGKPVSFRGKNALQITREVNPRESIL